MTQPSHDDVVAAVVNFNTAALTLRCVRSLLDAGIARILVLDNASARADFDALAARAAALGPRVSLIRSEENVGFAAGNNRLIEEALGDPRCGRVFLANSDSVVLGPGVRECLDAMRAASHDLMGGRMLKPPGPDGSAAVDSLGIALYKSLLASNRMSPGEAYLGPTGGFAVYSRRFLEEVRRLHGHVFEPSFFCYAEDTDLCVRARLLGASVGYVDAVVAHHAGQGSNSGTYGDFILYHGIRNSIWMLARSIPGAVILRFAHWVVVLHCAIVLRHLLQGRWRTLARLYRDAVAGLPAALRDRRRIQASRRATAAQFRAHVDPHFYEPAFVKGALRDLVRRGHGREGPAGRASAEGGKPRALAEVGHAGVGLEIAPGVEPAPGEERCDWIVASDVERAPDLVAFLARCESMLRDDGVLALVAADKREGPDRSRPVSSLAAVLEAHLEGRSKPSPGALAEHFAARGMIDEARGKGSAAEVRSWCFVPHSLRLLVEDLHALGRTGLREARYLPTRDGEFVLVLARHGPGPAMARLELMRAMDFDLAGEAPRG